MTREEAAYILDPKTTRTALAPYAYDPDRRLAVVREAHKVAVESLRAADTVATTCTDVTTPCEELTIEQLREMDGQPVHVKFTGEPANQTALIGTKPGLRIVFSNGNYIKISKEFYGTYYKVYEYTPDLAGRNK